MGKPAYTPQAGEQELWNGRTHFKCLFPPFMIQLLLIAIHILTAIFVPYDTGWVFWNSWGHLIIHGTLVLVSLWYVIAPLLRWRNATFEITNKRVIKHWGLLYRHSREIPLDRIASVSVERGIIDRIFRCGTIVFQDAAAGFQPETSGSWNKTRRTRNTHGVRFHDVPQVKKVQEVVDQARFQR